MTEPAVIVRDVSKKFGETQALDGVSFETNHGELFGLVGPDGAGKTTLFRILTTLIIPDSGTATVLGLDVVAGSYRLPWEDDVVHVDGASCGFDPPTALYERGPA